MNFNFREKPIIFKILLIICLFVAAMMIFSLFRNMRFSTNITVSLLKIFLWLFICVGFYKIQKWAWASLFVLVLFSILNIIHSLVSLRIEFNLFPLISIIIGALIIWALNVSSIRNLFQVDFRKGQNIISGITYFAVFCITIGLFLLTELLGINRIASSSISARLFIAFMGFVYLLLGIGIWQLNKIAFQAVHPVLIFTVLSASFILAYDFFVAKRFLALRNFFFYISISTSMLIYWVNFIRPKIPKDYY